MLNAIIPTKNPGRFIYKTVDDLLQNRFINKVFVIDQSDNVELKFFSERIKHVKTKKPKSAISARAMGAKLASDETGITGLLFVDDDIKILSGEKDFILILSLLKNGNAVSFTIPQVHSKFLIFIKFIIERTLKKGVYYDDRIVRNLYLIIKKKFRLNTLSVSAGAMALPVNYCINGAMNLIKCRGYPIQAGDLELAQEIYLKYNKKFIASNSFIAVHPPYDYKIADTKLYISRYDTKNILRKYNTVSYHYWLVCLNDIFNALAHSVVRMSMEPLFVCLNSISNPQSH